MLFNSVEFIFFLGIVFFVYWFAVNRNLKIQNFFLLISSYVFYGWWDWRFLSLIFLSSIVDYLIGIYLSRIDDKKKRKILLLISLSVNLGLLGVFKYFNFFIDSFTDLLGLIGLSPGTRSLNIILPVGISFYTFQTLSYTIDIYRKKMEPTTDVIAFFAFVSFFPQLVAGPIERAKNLLPQFHKKRIFIHENAIDGLRQILWGLFKKIVVADTCASHADYIFENYTNLDGSMLFLGIIYFAFQIYGDFSGYSDIAIGTARLFGIDLMRNFAFPYFSRDIAEFWRRWHISLSSWFRDYLYIPLGGSYGSKFRRMVNILITFTVSGFWHGANWTFIFWGFLNGLYYIPIMVFDKQKANTEIVAQNSFFPNIKEFGQIIITFILTLIAWVFFRSDSIQQAFHYIQIMFSSSLFSIPSYHRQGVFWIILLILIEWIQRKKQHGLQFKSGIRVVRWLIYITIIITIITLSGEEKAFIYFQF